MGRKTLLSSAQCAFVIFTCFYPQNWVCMPSADGGIQQKVQVLHWTQANQLTDSMDAGEPVN